MKKDFEKFVDQELGAKDGFHPTDGEGRIQLPRIGARCLWRFRPGATINGHACPKGFCAFGYRYDAEIVYLPLYREKLSINVMEAWKRVEGPDYWNGTGRLVNEAFQ